MLVRGDDDKCTYTECGHPKCHRCTTEMKTVPLGTGEIIFPSASSFFTIDDEEHTVRASSVGPSDAAFHHHDHDHDCL